MTGPCDSGHLDPGDDRSICRKCCGDPVGRPVLVVHGGPGSGCTPTMRDVADLDRRLVVLFDQRDGGRSRPHAGDPATELHANNDVGRRTHRKRGDRSVGTTRARVFGCARF